MAVSGTGIGCGNRSLIGRLMIILEMIKFEHTIFALPFALISMLLASRALPHGLPGWRIFGWIVAAMVGARSAAMAFNRIVDARFDALNPRTARRAIPAGTLSPAHVGVFTVVSVGVFMLAAYELNPLCFALSPVALAVILGYSYSKRFTSLSHVILGFGIGIAPIGAWLAVTGKFHAIPLMLWICVMLWIGGFDIIYALQDVEFDSETGLHSIPRSLGKSRALGLSRAMHLALIGMLLAVGVFGQLHYLYFVGVAIAAVLIAYEHSIVTPEDLSRVNMAFFTLNGWVSVALLLFVILDLAILR
jgi:4-hydroxybenzoate polyprenyltransferase